MLAGTIAILILAGGIFSIGAWAALTAPSAKSHK